MRSYTSFRSTQKSPTPRSLKNLIYITIGMALWSALFNHLFQQYQLPTPQEILSLSAYGIKHSFFWEFFSYLFVGPPSDGITFSLILHLVFNAYLLWVIGTSFIERNGRAHFFSLYFLGGIFAGAAIFGVQLFSADRSLFATNLTSIYAILLAWAALYPKAQLLLFLSIPIKARNLIWSLLGVHLLFDLSSAQWTSACGYAVAGIFGHFYGSFLLINRSSSSRKRYDFKTGNLIAKEEDFLDAILAKIAAQGRGSLTLMEKWKLRRIMRSKKKIPPST